MNLEEKSYVYGLLLTDGTLDLKNEKTFSGQIQLEVNEIDEDIVDKLCVLIPYGTKTKRIRDTNFKTNYHSVKFSISRQEFIKELIASGFVFCNKSYNARPPVIIYDKNAFWRGVIDGDGSLGIRKTSRRPTEAFLSLTTKSEILKNEFCNYMQSITGETYTPKRNNRDSIYNIGCGGHNACKVLSKIYDGATIYLNRKYQKYLECIDWKSKHNPLRRNTSGVIGVCFCKKTNKWLSYIMVNREKINLGVHDDKENAIIARLQAEKKYFGECALQKNLFKQYILED